MYAVAAGLFDIRIAHVLLCGPAVLTISVAGTLNMGMAIYTVIKTVSTPYFTTLGPIQNTGYLHRSTTPTLY